MVNRRLRLRFLSFTTGYRPDILDTTEYLLSPNTLSENQTGVEWTHVLGSIVHGRFVLLIERLSAGIGPGVMEDYLPWMVDEFYETNSDSESDDKDPITITLEPESSEEFIQRIEALNRITNATVRIARPNPGWADLDSELSGQADLSDAAKVEVSMIARRGASLSRDESIISAIRDLYNNRELGFARVKGEVGGHNDNFTTDRLGNYRFLELTVDERGQVTPASAWQELSRMMNSLD